MQPPNLAWEFLAMAEKDFAALEAMTGPPFAIEVFGFHAQQAVEKCLRAWIECLAGESPMTHSIVTLLSTLEDMGANVRSWWDLTELTGFAVQFRYHEYDVPGGEPDRAVLIQRVSALMDAVRIRVADASGESVETNGE